MTGSVDKQDKGRVRVGILLLLLSTFMWSFVGILVKSASLMVSPLVITFFRFFIGVLFLALLVYLLEGKVRIHWKSPWIWAGAAGKFMNYIFENIGVSIGYAYGNVLVFPLQTLFMVGFSILFLKEKFTLKIGTSVFMCIVGVLLVSWNGLPLQEVFQLNALLTLLFTLSAFGATFHFLSQKMLLDKMNSASMNFSMFLWSSLFAGAPLPVYGQWTGTVSMWPVVSLVLLGAITGFSFYFFAQALRRVSLTVASVCNNASVIFTLLWAWLFFNEPITIYTVTGTALFAAGMLFVNLPQRTNRSASTGQTL